jgi:xylose isomerase
MVSYQKEKKMVYKMKLSTCLAAFCPCGDRFASSGYKDRMSKEEILDQIATIPDCEAIEAVGTWDINSDNVSSFKELLAQRNLKLCSIVIDIFTRPWQNGSFMARDKKIRKKAIQVVKDAMDWASEIDNAVVDIWPGQDGWDYPFATNYVDAWGALVDGIREACDYRPDIRVTVEPKIKEPRTHIMCSGTGITLLLVREIDRPNLGICIDVGHGLAAYENVANSIAICKAFGDKLFHMHFNDSYRNTTDDDLMVASVHTIEYLEMVYWLRKTGFSGYWSLDTFPYREDALACVKENFEWLKAMNKLVDRIGEKNLDDLIHKGSPPEVMAAIRKGLGF